MSISIVALAWLFYTIGGHHAPIFNLTSYDTDYVQRYDLQVALLNIIRGALGISFLDKNKQTTDQLNK